MQAAEEASPLALPNKLNSESGPKPATKGRQTYWCGLPREGNMPDTAPLSSIQYGIHKYITFL